MYSVDADSVAIVFTFCLTPLNLHANLPECSVVGPLANYESKELINDLIKYSKEKVLVAVIIS